MEQLLYISTSRSVSGPSTEEIEQILAASRRNNARDNLSGLLLVGERRFLQVLEGPSSVLDQAYDRIRSDPRHFALVQLSRKPVDDRSFRQWDMGYEAGEGCLGRTVAKLTAEISDPSLRAQLESFAQLHRRAA